MTGDEVRISGYASPNHVHQEIRLSLSGGGPGGTEMVVDCDEGGTSIRVWNPIRRVWARINLVSSNKENLTNPEEAFAIWYRENILAVSSGTEEDARTIWLAAVVWSKSQ